MTREEAIKMLTSEEWLYDEHNFTQDEIAAIRSVCNPWHKASEELPKNTCKVLICWETTKHERKWTQVAMFRRNSNNPEDCWFEDDEEYKFKPDYWMEIPELSKED